MHTIVKRAMRNKRKLLWGLAACAGRPTLPSGSYTSFISRSDALSQAGLNATARGIIAGYWEMRGGDGLGIIDARPFLNRLLEKDTH